MVGMGVGWDKVSGVIGIGRVVLSGLLQIQI